jgi:copper(I)-binding protein
VSPTRLLPAALLAVALPLAGCAAGQNDTTSHERGTPYTADAKVGPVIVNAVRIVPAGTSVATPAPAGTSTAPSPAGSAAPSATASTAPSTPPGGTSGGPQAYLTLTVASSTTDTLTGASIQGATITPSATGAALTVRPNSVLVISDPQTATTPGQPSLAITGLPQPPTPGTTMKVTLTFQTAGSVTVDAPVQSFAA